MDIERKSVDATVTAVEDSKSKHGEFDVILSTSALDRDGDELGADEWKTPLPERITFDSDHGLSVATCVGSGKPFINDDGQLQVRGTFASTPHGQAVRTLVNEGHISNVSVAFRNLKTQKDAKPQRELINGAFVVAPANPEARVLSSKAAKDDQKITVTVEGGGGNGASGIITPKDVRRDFNLSETDAIGDMFGMDSEASPQRKAYWQGVHDLAIKLGAGCPYSDPSSTPDVLNVSNRSADDVEIKSSPQEELTEESTAVTADEAAVTADESADDDAALRAKMLAIAIKLQTLDLEG